MPCLAHGASIDATENIGTLDGIAGDGHEPGVFSKHIESKDAPGY